MSDPRRDLSLLAAALRTLDDALAGCMKCGLCQSVCPVFSVTKRETDVARGKLALLGGLAGRMFKGEKALEAVEQRLNHCLLCGSCAAQCPSGVPLVDIFLKARVMLAEYRGLSTVKKTVFRGLLARPGLFHMLARLGRYGQHAVFRPTGSAQRTVSSALLSPLLGKRHVAPLQAPLHVTVGELDTSGSSGLRVAFFPGCLGDAMFPSMSLACLKALRWHGVGIFLPHGFACCGIPALASGDMAGFRAAIKVNLELLARQNFDAVVTPCGTCTHTISHYWPDLADPSELSYKARRLLTELSGKTLDIHAFLVLHFGVGSLPPKPGQKPVSVTYHDPCHLKKGLGVRVEPRQLLHANPAVKLREMSGADLCCGHGGTFNLFHYRLSQTIGERKRRAVTETGAETVATGCPACMLQLMDLLAQKGDKTRVRHSMEIYADGLPDENAVS